VTLDLPNLTAAEAGYLTQVARHGGAASVRFMDADWRLRLTAVPEGAAAPVDLVEPEWLTIDLGGARVRLGVDGAVFRHILRTLDPGGDPADLPEPLRLALCELALEGLTEALESTFGHAVRILSGEAVADASPHRVDVFLTDGDGRAEVRGVVLTDARGLAVIADLAARLPETPPLDEHTLAAVPVPLRFTVGWTRLPVSEVRALEPRDVILLDDTTFIASDRLILTAPGLGHLTARLDGPTLTIEDIARNPMAEDMETPPEATETPAPDAAEPLLGSLDEVEVQLTFDIGQHTLTLGQLRTLTAGAVFNLGRDPRGAVNIRANGRLVGTGELVRVDDHVGVRIATLPGTVE
jgi:type III secretion protein Q